MSRYGSDFAHLYEAPKIMYPVISKEPRFAMDKQGYFGNGKTFFVALEDWYLLGVLNSESVRNWVAQAFSPLRGGYYEFHAAYMETLPIPDAPAAERKAAARLAEQAQKLHTQRRKRVEKFLRDLGTSPAESSSRNPLEQPWQLEPDEFARRVKKLDLTGRANLRLAGDLSGLHAAARDETAALTGQIARVEKEIDARVAGLYGV